MAINTDRPVICPNVVPNCGANQHIAIGVGGCPVCVDNTPDSPGGTTPISGTPPPGSTCVNLGNGCYLCDDGNTYCPPPCGGGGGGDPGGGGGDPGGGGGPSGCPTGSACIFHDGSIVDSTTHQPIGPDPTGCYSGYTYLPTYYGVPVDQLPHCDDDPSKCPTPPASQTCDKCVTDALNAINETLKNLKSQAGKCFDDNGDITADCFNKLLKKIKDQLLPDAKTCDECCERIKMGLATEASCQSMFANCECQRCTDQCSQDTEGKCCTSCGQEKCTCKNFNCVPDDTPTKKWTAWCDHTTGVHLSTDDGNPPPVAGDWVNSGIFDTFDESDAITCTMTPPTDGGGGGQTGTPAPPSVLPTSGIEEGSCQTYHYEDRFAARAVLEAAAPVNVEARTIQAVGSAFSAISAAPGGSVAIATAALTSMGQYVAGSFLIDLSADIISAASGLDGRVIKPALQTLSALSIAESWVGLEIPQVKLPIEYALNAALRPRIYSPEQAITAYLSNTLPKESIDRYFAAAGYCEGIWQGVLTAAVAKPVPQELLRLNRWGTYDRDEYNAGMRRLGYDDQTIVDNLYDTSWVRPGLGEMLHMMIRDADNDKVKQTFDFDVRFEDKFGPTIKLWCEQQGIQEDVVRMAYRSHWDIPSKTELFEFWRRLRNLPVGTPGRITEDELRAALTHNNILPHWFDSYMLTLYNPISRIDIRRGYTIGAISDDQAKNAFQQIGYSDDNIDLLMKFLVRLKEAAAPKHPSVKLWQEGQKDVAAVKADMQADGFKDEQINKALELAGYAFKSGKLASSYIRGDLTAQQFSDRLHNIGVPLTTIQSILGELSYGVKYKDSLVSYKAGIITRSVAAERLTRFGVDNDVASNQLDAIDDEIDAKRAARCVGAVRKRFLLGELTKSESVSALRDAGIVTDAAESTAGGWECEIASRDKAAPTQTLCGWLARGSITSEDFYNRMIRLGYSEFSANQLLVDCLSRISVKQAQDEAKRIKQERSDADKAAARARRNQALVDKENAKAATARKALASLRAKRQGQLLHAAGLVMKGCDCVEMDAIGAVTTAVQQLRDTYGLTEDEAIAIAVQASENNWGGKASDYVDKAMQLGELIASTEADTGNPII